MIISGFACHTLTDMLPMFWGKDMAVVATDGNVDQEMIVFMMTLSYLIPVCGLLCLLTDCRAKLSRTVNAVLAVENRKCGSGCHHRIVQCGTCFYGTAFR